MKYANSLLRQQKMNTAPCIHSDTKIITDQVFDDIHDEVYDVEMTHCNKCNKIIRTI